MNAVKQMVILSACTLALAGRAAPTEDPLPDRITPVAADQQIPVVDFFRPLLLAAPTLNPAGTHFAALMTNREFCVNVLVCDLAKGNLSWTDTGFDVGEFFWLDEKNLAVISRERPGNSWVFGIEKLAKHTDLYDSPAAKKSWVLGDVDFSFEKPWIREMPPGTAENRWALWENGDPAFCLMKYRDARTLYRLADKKWVKVPVDMEVIEPLDIGEKPGEMIVLGPRQDGKPRALQRLDTVTGQLGEVLYQDAQFEGVDRIIHRPGSYEVIGLSLPHASPRIVWFGAKQQEVQKLIDRAFPGSVAQIVNSDRAENLFLIQEISDRKPPVFFTVDLAKHSLSLLKNSGPWIDPVRSRPMQVMSYKARDGATIDAFVTMPAGVTKDHPCPLVVLPHWGPRMRDNWGWDETVQFLVSRGYAVFQPQYRGSLGYDWRFAPGDRWEFGKMHNDVTDGTKALFKTGLIDRQRVAILGRGFGGYLAICGAVYEPDLYCCALALGGIFDWKTAIEEDRLESDDDLQALKKQLGDMWTHRDRYEAISPLHRAKEIKIPLLITNNLTITDLTYKSESKKLWWAMPMSDRNMVVGDLNVRNDKQFRADLVKTWGKIEEFLATNLKPGTTVEKPAAGSH